MIEPRALFEAIFAAAVRAADPAETLARHLPARPAGRTIVVGAGKGSAQMAAALEEAWDGPLEGVVVTRYGYAAPCRRIEVIEAAHPVPDEAGLEGARRLMAAVQGLTKDDLVIALISGGGSALLPAPAEDLTLEDEIALNRALLASGAPISVMNTVRKHASTIKGGRLAAAAHPAKVVTLVVSDIPGDQPSLVSSGPTIPDSATRQDALAIVEEFRLDLPDSLRRHLESEASAAPSPNEPRFAHNEVHVIASARQSLEAAVEEANRHGVKAVILSDSIEGEAREVGKVHAAVAREIAMRNRPFERPVLLLSGGETTVTVRDQGGRGGRNGEFLLSFAIATDGLEDVHGFAADTDGIDGSEANAGAFADWTTTSRMRAKGLDPKALLANNDSWRGFDALGDLFSPGPTGTNVNDLRAVWIR